VTQIDSCDCMVRAERLLTARFLLTVDELLSMDEDDLKTHTHARTQVCNNPALVKLLNYLRTYLEVATREFSCHCTSYYSELFTNKGSDGNRSINKEVSYWHRAHAQTSMQCEFVQNGY